MTTKRRKRHTPEQIVRKLRDAEAMLNAGRDEAAVSRGTLAAARFICVVTYDGWRISRSMTMRSTLAAFNRSALDALSR